MPKATRLLICLTVLLALSATSALAQERMLQPLPSPASQRAAEERDEQDAIPKGQFREIPRLTRSFSQGASNEAALLSEDFETGAPDWDPDDEWEVGAPVVGPAGGYNSPNLVGTDLDGSYGNYADERLYSPTISLEDVSPNMDVTLRFAEWFELESGHDFGSVWVTTDFGDNWIRLNRRSGSSDWRITESDLTSFVGQEIVIAFQLVSDGSVTGDGWYVDAVEIVQAEPEPLTASISSLNSQNFSNIYANVTVDALGVGVPDLTQDNFAVYENGVLQTDRFNVTPPEEGGGVRLADIIFLMDNSGSMEEEQAAVEANVFDFVDALVAAEVDFSLGLARYGAYQNSGNPILADGGSLTSNAAYFKNDVWTRNVTGGGTEPGYYAITESASGFSFRPGAKRIFIIITDESPDQRNTTLNDAFAALTDGDITLFALTEDSYYDDFQPLTAATDGAFFDIYSPFDAILDFIAEQVASTYVVSYRSSNPDFDGTTRTVRVEVTHESNTAFDEATYIPGAAPSIARTQATKDLEDQNWAQGTEFTIEAEITDDVAPSVQGAQLFYKPALEEAYTPVDMEPVGGGIWRGVIPGEAADTVAVDYYITGTDGISTSSKPIVNPGANPFDIAIMPNDKPFIAHTPKLEGSVGEPVEITAEVVDNTNEVASVTLFYRRAGQLIYQAALMLNTSGNVYEGVIPEEVTAAPGIIEYYIKAIDDVGTSRSDGLPFLPHVTLMEAPWPDAEGPAITFKVIAPSEDDVQSMEMVAGAGVTEQLVKLRTSSEDDVAVSFFTADAAALSRLTNQGTIGTKDNERTKEFRLFRDNGSVIGHIAFEYTMYERNDGKKVDAVLYVHTDRRPNLDDYSSWGYYEEGEYPVSMLIPPGEDFQSIDESQEPLMLVHGVSGTYPYWGENMVEALNEEYDTWQFYYPYDQPIQESSPLLGKALEQLTTADGLVQYEPLDSRVNVVTHSMGGLVARWLVQSEFYQEKIERLLMMGPPNHGSFSTYRFLYTGIGGIIGKYYLEKDEDAPAYRQMIPGSQFTYHLNNSAPQALHGEESINTTYLVLAGTDGYPTGHSEIADQDDGLVAVSSASLLNYGVPLATVDLRHTGNGGSNLKEEAGSIILRFLRDYANPSDYEKLGEDVTGFWSDQHSSPQAGFNLDEGILTLTIPGSEVNRIAVYQECDLYGQENGGCEAFELKLGADGSDRWDNANSTPSVRAHNFMQRVGSRSNYFSLNTDGLNDIGFDFPEGRFRITIEKSNGVGSWDPFWTNHPFRFSHLQTTMDTLHLSVSELTILNSNSAALALAASGGTTASVSAVGITSALHESRFYVDATIDSLVFWLAGFESESDHNLQLILPSGTVIDSTAAKGRQDMEYKQNLSAGFAFYYVQDPEPGTWTVQYNKDLTEAVLSAPVIGGIETDIIFPDSAFVAGNTIEFDITTGSSVCTDPQATVTLFHAEEGEAAESRGEVPLSTSSSTAYEGQFTADEPGVYFAQSNFTCMYEGEQVRRQSIASVGVGGTAIAPPPEELPEQFVLQQNYPNPFTHTTTITYELPEPQHVTLTVYDILGRKVATPVDEEQTAGRKEVPFNARGLPSGIYFYRFTAGEYVEARKMVVVR